jgi:hypothetical protein
MTQIATKQNTSTTIDVKLKGKSIKALVSSISITVNANILGRNMSFSGSRQNGSLPSVTPQIHNGKDIEAELYCDNSAMRQFYDAYAKQDLLQIKVSAVLQNGSPFTCDLNNCLISGIKFKSDAKVSKLKLSLQFVGCMSADDSRSSMGSPVQKKRTFIFR